MKPKLMTPGLMNQRPQSPRPGSPHPPSTTRGRSTISKRSSPWKPTTSTGAIPITAAATAAGPSVWTSRKSLLTPKRRNWLFLSAARSVEYYKGTNLLSDEELANFAAPLTQLQERCGKLGIRLIVLIAPNKEQIYSEYMPTYTVENEDKREPRLIRYLQEKGITALYPAAELKAGDLYHETYHRYDTHWTPYGAYIADYLIEKELGMDPEDPYSPDLPVTEKTISSGDLISLGNLSAGNYPSVQYYVPDVDAEYGITGDDLSENGNVRRTESDNPNGLSLVLVGDSFRVNMSDPLARGFQKTLILHRDYLDASMKDEILDADVLIVEAVERFDVLLPGSVRALLEILPD